MNVKKIVCFFMVCLFLPISFSTYDVDAVNDEDFIANIIINIDEELVGNYIQTLQDFGPRVTETQECQLAAEYIYQEFQQMGLTVQFLPWSNGGYEDRNVEAVLPGEKDESIIVCAHYDTVPGSPSADDNGSGTAAVLAAAKAISDYKDEIKCSYTIRFVTFSGEEEGLLGSFSYAADANESGMQIVGVLNADMIGYTESDVGKERVHIFEGDISKWITNMSIDVAETYREFIGLNISRGRSGGSDHLPFLRYGYSAVFFHEYQFNDYWHTPDDIIANMDLEYGVRVTRLIVASLLQLVNLEIIDDEPPSMNIARPKEGYLYVFDREIMPSVNTIILGKITVGVNASDAKTGINKVEIYIDGNLEAELITYPYEFVWDEFVLFSHGLKAVAYDNAGNMATDEQEVWIFNF